MRFRLKGCQTRFWLPSTKPEEMPDYLFRQLGLIRPHEWEAGRTAQATITPARTLPGHEYVMSGTAIRHKNEIDGSL